MGDVSENGSGEDAHRFGGPWTLIKLEALQKYLAAYTQALKKQSFRLLYIDAFAGTGNCDVGMGGETLSLPGSARIALETTPAFHDLIFIEQDTARCAALRTLATSHPGRTLQIIQGEANAELAKLCASTNWTKTRAVLFLDPYGLELEWGTLEAIAKTQAIDVWYLFPLSGLYRQLARDSRAIDAGKEAIVTKLLGTDSWKQELYSPTPTKDMFGDDREERHADVKQITELATRRLKSVFAQIAGPKLLHLTLPNRRGQGAPMYALYFAVSNPNPKAAGLACRIAGDVLKSV